MTYVRNTVEINMFNLLSNWKVLCTLNVILHYPADFFWELQINKSFSGKHHVHKKSYFFQNIGHKLKLFVQYDMIRKTVLSKYFSNFFYYTVLYNWLLLLVLLFYRKNNRRTSKKGFWVSYIVATLIFHLILNK